MDFRVKDRIGAADDRSRGAAGGSKPGVTVIIEPDFRKHGHRIFLSRHSPRQSKATVDL